MTTTIAVILKLILLLFALRVGNAQSDCGSGHNENCVGWCDGTADKADGDVCRPGYGTPNGGTECDPAETCNCGGTYPCDCPANTNFGSGVCRAGSGFNGGTVECDPPENCPGSAGGVCPTDVVQPAGTLCRAGGADLCVDPNEHCTGVVGDACPDNLAHSDDPGCAPSSQPSTQPSQQPSSIPSEQPSGQPSSIPSLQPSSIPSLQPSSIPSEQPSGQPSSIPSLQPSSIPSEQPSGQPSSIPSLQPSSIPSFQPSSQPSSQPSMLPSCTPSMSPTDPATMHLFYPDWSPGSEGCANDGREPVYMSQNPSDYLSSSLSSCCNKYFSWNYDVCMGNLPGLCARSLWYPDWEGSNDGCVDDGNEPPYMTNNKQYYLFTLREDCCREHFGWNFDECVGDTGLKYQHLWFPDWEGSDHVCRNGGTQPQYMNIAPEVWMHETLAECCSQNYEWNYDECIGTSPAQISPGSGLYYPDWENSDHVCRNDGNQPAYMTQNPTQWMHNTLQECCDKNYSWNLNNCLGAPAGTGTLKFWMDHNSDMCVRDCPVGDPGCGGVADQWTVLYVTLNDCCQNRNWWNDECEDLVLA